MKGIIDRFEGEFVILEWEGRNIENIPKELLPSTVKEGDVIEFENGNYKINLSETNQRKKELKQLSEGLWED
ncbi:MAG TPA: DUF3006 domain-containing protein [Candidatus Deferrimicrobium sp.]|nr:DUF3006 domain-containing protein [Candidatus Deferrimicrobium sp.]